MTVRYTNSTTPHDNMKITTDVTSTKTLTPQRKHRKLLKSGEGEVWSEDVEKVFVEGLHQYWESPWATYSRGRSRWRNQFLVDYLQKAGIERSKKQVASHVQVLRNMWKGEKEYHLVAGGEELFLETGLLAPVKQEDSCDISVLSPADTDDSFLISPITPSTTGFSPPPFKFEDHSGLLQMPSDNSQPASPVGSADSHLVGSITVPMNSIARGRSTSLPGLHRRYTAPISSPLAPRPASSSFDVQTYHHLPSSLSSPGPSSVYHVDLRSTQSGTSSASSSLGYEIELAIKEQNPIYYDSPRPSPVVSSPPLPLAPNRLSCINLFAEGMQPFSIPLAALTANDAAVQPPPRLLIRIKITLPSIDDIHGSPTLHGIHGTLSFTRPWVTSANCVTDVYAASVHHSRDIAPLQPPTIDSPLGECTTSLPESELTRCRWLDSSKQTSIYQRVVVDNDTMAVIVYDLDRNFCDNSLFAEVVGFQKYRVNSEKPQSPAPVSPSPYTNYNYAFASQTHCVPRTRYPEQTSLSCALTPIGGRPTSKSPLTCTSRPSAQATSMLF